MGDTYSVSTPIDHKNVHILPQTPQLIALLTWVPLTHTQLRSFPAQLSDKPSQHDS